MKKRITMNSLSLQQKFPEVYREFFSKCPIVVSAPGNFWWTGEYSVLVGGLAIKQNLPLRAYIGFENNSKSKIELGKTMVFLGLKNQFINYNFSKNWILKTERLITEIVKDWSDQTSGFKINVLLEIPPFCGLCSSSALSAALSLALHLCFKKITIEQIQQWQQKPISQLKNDNLFDQIFRLAVKIESIYHNNASSGAGPFASLVGSMYPVVYFIADKYPKSKFKISNYIDGTFLDYDLVDYYGFRIDELVNLSYGEKLDFNNFPEWPIDFGVIYSGDVCSTELADRSQATLYQTLGDNKKRWQKILHQPIFNNKPRFYQVINQPADLIDAPYIKSLALISSEVFRALVWLFREGMSDEALEYLFETLNANEALLNVADVSSKYIDNLCRMLDMETKKLGDELGIGAKTTGQGLKGDIVFATAYHGLRDNIDKIINKLQKTTKENIWLDYASWLDGFEEEGVKVEQHLADGIYSKFIFEGSISLKSFTKEGVVQTELNSLEDFEKEKPKIDLLLDAIESDVYVKGKKLTSKEIPSASMVEEILGILLENIGKSISNSKLPESSYSQDRNEMQSKIVSPLLRAVKKYTHKNLPLKIIGGLTDFCLKLEPSDLDIRVLNKIF